MPKNKIEPSMILTISTHNLLNIPIIVTTNTGEIQTMTHIEKLGLSHYKIRQLIRSKVDELIGQYGIDTILLEQNQLFIDKVDKYPDPMVLQNVLLGFSIKTTIEDRYWESIKYIMELPRWEWKNEILNKKVDYAIDLYKSHVLLRQNLSAGERKDIENNNYYEALCLSESMLHSKFLHIKYQVNK